MLARGISPSLLEEQSWAIWRQRPLSAQAAAAVFVKDRSHDTSADLADADTLLLKQKEQYPVVALTLLTLETVSLRIGIPWLFPTRRVRALRSSFYSAREQIADYLRLSLVTVTTPVLESYLEDLEKLPDTQATEDALGIRLHSVWERFSFLLLLMIGTAFVGIVSIPRLVSDLLTASVLLGSVMLLACALALSVAGTRARKASFVKVLCREIQRRRGLDSPGGGRLHLCSSCDSEVFLH